MDTTKNILVVHDGATPGGHPVAKQSEVDAAISTINDAVALKANADDVTDALALKADAESVNDALDLKANADDVADSLALKADAEDVAGFLSFEVPQALTDPQKAQARGNIGFEPALFAYNRWKDIEVFDVPVGSPVVNYTKTGLSAFESLNLEGSLFVTVNAQIGMFVSSDNGATWRTTSDHYSHLYAVVNAAMGSGQNPGFGGLPMSYDLIFANTEFSMLGSRFFSFNKSNRGRLVTDMSFINSSGNTETGRVGSWEPNNTAGRTARNAIRVFPGSGNIYGKFVLSGREG